MRSTWNEWCSDLVFTKIYENYVDSEKAIAESLPICRWFQIIEYIYLDKYKLAICISLDKVFERLSNILLQIQTLKDIPRT